jgi:CheY-like chemotaxis protein
MADRQGGNLQGRRLLVAEDEYLLAVDIAQSLEDAGAEVVGPASSVKDALGLVASEDGKLDGALLDINLREERVYPVADALLAAGVPFIFATGYTAHVIPEAYADVPRCEKPVDRAQLTRMLSKAVQRS